MSKTVPSSNFSTSDFPADHQFEAWRDKISVVFDVARTGGSRFTSSFAARVDAYMIGNLVVADSTQGEQAYSVSPSRARAADMDLFQIALYRSGGYRGDADGNPIEGRAGDVEVLDLGRSMQAVDAASHTVCVFVPREALQERVGNLDGLHGVDLRSSMGGLLADYLGLLAERLPQMPESDGEAAASATIEMIAACLRPTANAIGEAQAPIQDVTLLRAKRLIEERLRSPQLSPEFLCRTLHVSRRSLYRLFEPLGGVHQYILRRRLSHVRRILKDPCNRRPIADVAEQYGFSNPETFWRAFKRQYGVTPGDVRSSNSSNLKKVRFEDVGFDQWLKWLIT